MFNAMKKLGLGVVSVLAILGFSKVASAAECKPISEVAVDGVKTFSNPVNIRGSATLTFRVSCEKSSSIGKLTLDSAGFDQTSKQDLTTDVVGAGGPVEITMRNPYKEWSVKVKGTKGDSKTLTVAVSSSESYSIDVFFSDTYVEQGAFDTAMAGKANKADLDKKQDAPPPGVTFATTGYVDDGDKKINDRIDGLGTGGEGRYVLLGGPMVFGQPGFDTSGGIQGYLGLRFAKPTSVVFELPIIVNAAFMGSHIPVRDVQGIPNTSPVATQSIFTFAVLPSASIPMFSQGAFVIGGGPAFQYLHTPEWTVGNDPSNQRQWFWKTQDEFSFLLMANVGFRFQLSSSASPAPSLMIGAQPGVQLVGTKKMDGGDKASNRFQIPVGLTFGVQI